MYSSPICGRVMAVPSYSRGVHSIYRLSALLVSCAFRTVSDEAALVIAGIVPLNELATELANSIRTEARMQSVTRWQARCDRGSKGRWTHRLIPNLEAWINRKYGNTYFYLTQLLSGHGCFRSYLKRFGHDNTDECSWCGRGIKEDANHVIFECGRFRSEQTGTGGHHGQTHHGGQPGHEHDRDSRSNARTQES
ncbi:uncharacterized protein [Drosophila virilis]|uniref:uncharacterized protein n=1 Tax=Drosophila virilis TaxID=7244 RepID=UPI0038B326A1